ncbi:MAG: 6-bladed beta-propeller [Prevotellaceae bacterium]|jgi:hypothetical protein|nr:6-bladed beta-propeller [Prevotellaceae bacterium]
MKKIIVIGMVMVMISLCLLVACNTKNNANKSHIEVVPSSIVIDIDKIEKKDTIYASSIFRKVNTIILEDSDNAIIGVINGMQIFDNFIFVLDSWKAKRLFVFNREGKYIRQIGNSGHGPGEYISISDFCIDPNNRKIYVLDDWKHTILSYSVDDGKYIGSIKLPNDISTHYIACSNNNKLYVNICPYKLSQGDDLLMEVDSETSKSKTYISAEQYNLGWNRHAFSDFNFFASKNYPLKYVELYMQTVFAITNDSIYPYITVKSDDWVKKTDIITEEEFNASEGMFQDEITYTRNRVERIHSYMEWDDYVYFEYYQKMNTCPVIYNKKTQEAIHYGYFKNDLVYNKNAADTKFFYTTSKAAYDYLDFDRLEYIIDKIVFAPDLDKKDEIMKLDKERFVIFEYEFK